MKKVFLNWLGYSSVSFMVIALLLFLVGEWGLLNKFWYVAVIGAMLSGFVVEWRKKNGKFSS